MTNSSSTLTRRQLRRMKQLPEDHKIVSIEGRLPIVRQPDGRLLRIRPSGRVVETLPVEHARSYLQVRD
jgi:hypothetical protein